MQSMNNYAPFTIPNPTGAEFQNPLQPTEKHVFRNNAGISPFPSYRTPLANHMSPNKNIGSPNPYQRGKRTNRKQRRSTLEMKFYL
ncbi:hypothetical protein CEXT_469581 [Caerostris extrusa]|uniref:Uncharacterized protein n=1 Tax=Caerostris extrusa TaxID=172846 RepID=A0AAV4W1F4_CAEEX|nr:hypothetical protein CEXT_469581 [Caerostris extrusa]